MTAKELERIAQRLYDFRDSVSAGDHLRTWNELNAIAGRLSKMAGELKRAVAPMENKRKEPK